MANPVALPAELLSLLVCPGCRAKLDAVLGPTATVALRCSGCGNAYPIVDCIPILIVDRAVKSAI